MSVLLDRANGDGPLRAAPIDLTQVRLLVSGAHLPVTCTPVVDVVTAAVGVGTATAAVEADGDPDTSTPSDPANNMVTY